MVALLTRTGRRSPRRTALLTSLLMFFANLLAYEHQAVANQGSGAIHLNPPIRLKVPWSERSEEGCNGYGHPTKSCNPWCDGVSDSDHRENSSNDPSRTIGLYISQERTEILTADSGIARFWLHGAGVRRDITVPDDFTGILKSYAHLQLDTAFVNLLPSGTCEDRVAKPGDIIRPVEEKSGLHLPFQVRQKQWVGGWKIVELRDPVERSRYHRLSQVPSQVQSALVEARAIVGYGGFADERILEHHHFVVGGSLRVYLRQRFGVEPEFLYMRHSEADQDFTFIPNFVLDLVGEGKRVVPYISGGIGILLHRDEFRGRASWGTWWTAGGGIGVKAFLTERLFVSPEFRLGWEPFLRVTGSIGYVLTSRKK